MADCLVNLGQNSPSIYTHTMKGISLVTFQAHFSNIVKFLILLPIIQLYSTKYIKINSRFCQISQYTKSYSLIAIFYKKCVMLMDQLVD